MRNEVALLGLLPFFKGHVYGAQQDYKTFSKKMVIGKLIADNRLAGEELLGFGDGYVEIEKHPGGRRLRHRRGVQRDHTPGD